MTYLTMFLSYYVPYYHFSSWNIERNVRNYVLSITILHTTAVLQLIVGTYYVIFAKNFLFANCWIVANIKSKDVAAVVKLIGFTLW